MSRHIVVVGAGIVGLATAAELTGRGYGVTVLEKEPRVAAHQTGRNSGVIHAGVYYTPGSLKARLCRAGASSMKQFAAAHGIAHATTGKLIVAVDEAERTQLAALQERCAANGIVAHLVDAAGAREVEPHVAAVAALHVPETGIIDYAAVCEALARQVEEAGGALRLSDPFAGARTVHGQVRILLESGERLVADGLVNCAGLHCDEVARACGVDPEVRIIPFRGEYYELEPAAHHLVNGLIYPVPDPRFPFLGVHLTRMVHGGVHAGPNAVLALAREGYTWAQISPSDLAASLAWPGLWHLAARYWAAGAKEMARSLSTRLFRDSLARLVPEVADHAITRAPAGIRAQALRRDGSLVDDFFLRTGPRQLHVLNAPSPAATASLEIAKLVGDEVEAVLDAA